ncbi:hypothetical protein HYU94_01255, partial [Candidatus Daviesbacteria bacterium]|nr:hypothetical protein [Candidatus Daviesbacteria bacterium]
MSNTNPEAEKGGMTRRHAIYLMGGAVFTGLAGGLGLNALLRTPPREEVVASGSTPTALDTATSVPSPTTAPATATSTATSTETPVPPTATDVPTKTPATATKPPEQSPNPQTELLKRDSVYSGDVLTEDGIQKGTLFLWRFSNVQMIASFALADHFTGDPGDSDRVIGHLLLRSSSTSAKDYAPVDARTKDKFSVSIADNSLMAKFTGSIGSGPTFEMKVPSMTYVGDGSTTYFNGFSAAVDKTKLHFSKQML